MQRLVELGADIAVIEKSATDFVTKTSGTRTCKGCGKKLRAGKACGKCAAKFWGRKAVELVIGHIEPAVALTIKSSRTVHPYYRSGRLVRGYTQQGPSRMQFAQGGLFGGEGEYVRKVTAEIGYEGVPVNSDFPDANGYMVTLRYRGRKMKTPYYMGPAIGREPTAHDVMTSLAMDAASYDNARGDFREWAREYGYDLDDPDQRRKTKRTFRAVERQAKQLREFLGEDYDDFLRRDEAEMQEVTAGSSGASKGIQRVRPHTRGGKPVRGYDRFHVVRVAAYHDAPAGSHLSEATRHAVADRERANGIVTNNFASREEAQREADALNAEHRSGSSVGDDDGNDDLDSSVRDSDSEINLWIDNDEGLYSWWKESRASKQDFIDEHRDELTEAIERAGGNLMEDREIRLWVLNDEGLYNDWIASGGDPDEDVSQAYIDEHRDELVPAIRQRMKGKSVSRARIEKVMREYKHGELHSGSKTGPKVKKRKQAIAIALSEASKSQMVVVGGAPETQD